MNGIRYQLVSKILKKPLLSLIVIIIIGFILRLLSFSSITFAFDQARDAVASMGIMRGDFKILGPSSDIHGLHHGILYWYIISPFYSFTGFGPYAVKVFLIFINLAVIPVTFLFAKKIFKNTFISLFAAFLCAVSFEAIQYSHWLSNPVPAFLTIPLSFFFLWQYIQAKNKYGLMLTAFFWGLSVQFEVFLLYQAAVFLLILIIFKKIKIIDMLLALVVALLMLSPFLLAEIKFGFTGFSGATSFFAGNFKSQGQTFNEMLSRASEKFIYISYYNVFANYILSIITLVVFIIVSCYYSLKRRDMRVVFLFLWFIFPVILFFIGSTNVYFAVIGSAIPFIILFAFYMREMLIVKKAHIAFILVLIIITTSSMLLLFENRGKGETLFSVQQNMVLNQEQGVIDWIYNQAEGRPFRLDTITNPLFINTTWGYLFDWYGRQKYGYMPFWWGYPQNGQFGEEIMFSNDFQGSKKIIFLIIEPNNGIPDFYVREIYDFENTRSKVTARKKFGNFTVEKREITKDKPFLKQEIDEGIKNNKIKGKLVL